MFYNKVIFAGNLTRDPEAIQSKSDSTITKFSIAVNKKTREKEEVLFLNCVAFDNLAEAIRKNYAKGDNVFIEGELKDSSYTDKEGVKRTSMSVIVNSARLLTNKFSHKDNDKSDMPEANNQKSSTIPTNELEDDIPF